MIGRGSGTGISGLIGKYGTVHRQAHHRIQVRRRVKW